MKPVGTLPLALIGALSIGFGATVSEFFASRGAAVPVAGWLSGLVLLVLAVVLLVLGLPLRRYLQECEERAAHPTTAPRRYSLDMPTAYRTIQLARAAEYTGTLCGGMFLGQTVYLIGSGSGDLLGAIVPTVFAGLSGVALTVVGLIVERWGTLPPQDGEDESDGETSHA